MGLREQRELERHRTDGLGRAGLALLGSYAADEGRAIASIVDAEVLVVRECDATRLDGDVLTVTVSRAGEALAVRVPTGFGYHLAIVGADDLVRTATPGWICPVR
ncbi:hypothetical protein ACFCYB_13720 [Streptomyces sp. NPDC056309]|uniref:hypothetical protein n=1 Tax=unclassified Streptomyces TaxID=2593676 RepID=UPI0035E028EE